jgi:hypothetical protein
MSFILSGPFFKKNNAIYVLIMSVNKQNIGLKPELLYDLINGSYQKNINNENTKLTLKQ